MPGRERGWEMTAERAGAGGAGPAGLCWGLGLLLSEAGATGGPEQRRGTS